MGYIAATKKTRRMQGVTIVCPPQLKPGSDIKGVGIQHPSMALFPHKKPGIHTAGHVQTSQGDSG